MKYKVFNLEFPSYCNQLNIGDYKFYRVENYNEQLLKLQHTLPDWVNGFGEEIMVYSSIGQHTITGYLEYSQQPVPSVLDWSTPQAMEIDDICLLLSIFTQRDVFYVHELFDEKNSNDCKLNSFRIFSPHKYSFSSVLRASIPLKIIDDIPAIWDLEGQVNQIIDLIRTQEWQNTYNKGYILFLARQAFKMQVIESAFIQCYTIWEHLFALHNQTWLSDGEITKLSSLEKISFILVHYKFMDEIKKDHKSKLQKLVQLRNRLIHYGKLSDTATHEDALLFIRLTEGIIAKILGLQPSNIFGTKEELAKFIK